MVFVGEAETASDNLRLTRSSSNTLDRLVRPLGMACALDGAMHLQVTVSNADGWWACDDSISAGVLIVRQKSGAFSVLSALARSRKSVRGRA
jgi:hypothetical protein